MFWIEENVRANERNGGEAFHEEEIAEVLVLLPLAMRKSLVAESDMPRTLMDVSETHRLRSCESIFELFLFSKFVFFWNVKGAEGSCFWGRVSWVWS